MEASSVPQGSILGQVFLIIIISDIDIGNEYTLIKFADDTKLSGAVDTIEGRDALLEGHVQAGKLAHTNQMVLYGKCRVLNLGQGNLR